MPRTPAVPPALRSAKGAAVGRAPVPAAAQELLAAARRCCATALVAPDPAAKYAAAHLGALRAAAAMLAARARPAGGRGRIRSAWTLLTLVAPELGEWAAFFASGAGRRAAAEAGLGDDITMREADDLLRAAEDFIAIVESELGLDPSLLSTGLMSTGLMSTGLMSTGLVSAG